MGVLGHFTMTELLQCSNHEIIIAKDASKQFYFTMLKVTQYSYIAHALKFLS